MTIEKKIQQFIVAWKDSQGNTRKFSTYAEDSTVALNLALESIEELHNNPALIKYIKQLSKY